MATLSNVTLSIVRNAANADVTVEFDITWSAFDRTTNVPYVESFRLIGDDTGQDIDDAGPGDDPIVIGLQLQQLVSANGRATTHRTRTRSIPVREPRRGHSALPERRGRRDPGGRDAHAPASDGHEPREQPRHRLRLSRATAGSLAPTCRGGR
jgi:hypothetical protein